MKRDEIEGKFDELIEWAAGRQTYNQPPRNLKKLISSMKGAAITNQQFINSLQSKRNKINFFFLSVNSMNLLICWIWWNKKVL